MIWYSVPDKEGLLNKPMLRDVHVCTHRHTRPCAHTFSTVHLVCMDAGLDFVCDGVPCCLFDVCWMKALRFMWSFTIFASCEGLPKISGLHRSIEELSQQVVFTFLVVCTSRSVPGSMDRRSLIRCTNHCIHFSLS